ncbi:MAG: GntR family transcriptional regulator [Ruminococcaceae bacterium]|nr:GntR family transcriptional regulator [Oscillospiraceae bacterium]
MAKRYLEIRREICRRIDSGEWQVGYKLPKETALCVQFDVGRTTVRHALCALVEEGKLRRVKGTGTFVSRPQILEKTTFFIQSFAKELKSQGLSCRTEVLECRTLRGAENAVYAALQLPNNAPVWKLRRLRYSDELLEKGPITLTTSYFPEEIGKRLEGYDFETTSLYSAMQEIRTVRARSEKTVSATKLPPKDCRLLSADTEDLFLTVTSVSCDHAGRPIEYCVSYFPVDRHTFRLHVVTDGEG